MSGLALVQEASLEKRHLGERSVRKSCKREAQRGVHERLLLSMKTKGFWLLERGRGARVTFELLQLLVQSSLFFLITKYLRKK